MNDVINDISNVMVDVLCQSFLRLELWLQNIDVIFKCQAHTG